MATGYIAFPGTLLPKIKEVPAQESITPEELVRDALGECYGPLGMDESA